MIDSEAVLDAKTNQRLTQNNLSRLVLLSDGWARNGDWIDQVAKDRLNWPLDYSASSATSTSMSAFALCGPRDAPSTTT